MPRFVLLYHDCPPDFGRASHWDLMLQSGEVLRTWALGELPQTSRPGQSIDAEELADHRLSYLEYEGPISGERGFVRREDSGTFESLVETGDRWEVDLVGRALRGKLTLQHVHERRWKIALESKSI